MCHFLAQVGHESEGFKSKQEGGIFTSKNTMWGDWINRKWKEPSFCISKPNDNMLNDIKKGSKKFKWTALTCDKDDNSCVKVPDEYIGGTKEFKGAENFLNFVYQCEGGNGDANTRDGYKYSGKGIIQLTWKNNYIKFNNWLKTVGLEKYDVIINPELLKTNTEVAIISAMWFWSINKDLNKFADEGKIDNITRDINGGENGKNERGKIYDKLKEKIK